MTVPLEPASVLVVDDDAPLARLLRVLLESEKFAVRVAHNGREALDRVAESVPDIVLLDLQMPVMDGRTFYREFRNQGYSTPVIILSAYNSDEARTELGAEAAMRKPFEPTAVIGVVRRLLDAAGRS